MLIISSIFSKVFAVSSDTLKLYYDIDASSLRKEQLIKLDSFLMTNQTQYLSALTIIAYTDFLASSEYNKKLSQYRADNVKQYLISKAYTYKINQCIGKGELPPELINQPLGVKENRRVEIIRQYIEKEVVYSNPKPINEAKEGEHIILKNLNFQPGRHYLTPASQPELEILLNTLIENPILEIEIQGHICCEFIGKDGLDQDTYSWDLSVHRAKYIYDFLIKNGISAERLNYKGFGSSKPLVYPEKTTIDENKNRRVEIVIVKK